MISWIKIETTLPQKPEMTRMALHLKITRAHAVGLCAVFWCWLDVASTTGELEGMDEGMIDDLVEHPGFTEAMCKVGWLARTKTGLTVPNFERHNGANSKRRAQTARRVGAHRMRNGGNSHGK